MSRAIRVTTGTLDLIGILSTNSKVSSNFPFTILLESPKGRIATTLIRRNGAWMRSATSRRHDAISIYVRLLETFSI